MDELRVQIFKSGEPHQVVSMDDPRVVYCDEYNRRSGSEYEAIPIPVQSESPDQAGGEHITE